METLTQSTHKIRPAGRHLLTIGRELIQNEAAAIIELVKNCYDADSDFSKITVEKNASTETVKITVEDNGHGMTKDVFLSKWMVPSTDDKYFRKTSPKNRVMQGRKGIGRYASSILGDILYIETVTEQGEKTLAKIDWEEFNKAQYLDEMQVTVSHELQSRQQNGTKITIIGNKEFYDAWDEDKTEKLLFELKKLISPLDSNKSTFKVFFKINTPETDIEIKPYPIVEFFDYRIKGSINSDGKGKLTYSCQKEDKIPDIEIDFDYYRPTQCGSLKFDLRVYDRETESLDELLGRGLRKEGGGYFSRQEIRNLLNEYNGIGVFRNGFRIRPLGDANFDWLELNSQRVQNPSLRVGISQIIGYVVIESEEKSNLIEKSARDGLRENQAYYHLINISKKVLAELEVIRFKYRESTGRSRKSETVEGKLSSLLENTRLKENVYKSLSTKNIDSESRQKISDEFIELIENDYREKQEALDYIRKAIATYQGQATLGKIINQIIHEGRRPLHYFKNEGKNLNFWYKKFIETNDEKYLPKILERADGIGKNAQFFVRLFSKIDPLATARRPNRKHEKLSQIIKDSINLFTHELEIKNISVTIECPDDLLIFCWPQDLLTIFINLIENSIYWIDSTNRTLREISILALSHEGKIDRIDYIDSGIGIKPEDIESKIIFEPSYSTKPIDGTGLGLSIAGEAALRNHLKLHAIEHENGAYFQVEVMEEAK